MHTFSTRAVLLATVSASVISISLLALLAPAHSLAQDTGTSSRIYCPVLSQTLQFGMRDSQTSPTGQVMELQKFLTAYDLNPDDYVTGYFGRLTRDNVRRFQCEQFKICSGDEATTGWGVVGPRTRAAIAQKCGVSTNTTNATTTTERMSDADFSAWLINALNNQRSANPSTTPSAVNPPPTQHSVMDLNALIELLKARVTQLDNTVSNTSQHANAHSTDNSTATSAAQNSGTASITINTGITYQTMSGFGSSERVFDDPHLTQTFDQNTRRAAVVIPLAQQNEILDKLYTELGLTIVRPSTPDPGGGIEPINDNADPNVTDLSKFNFSWKNLDDHCEYIKRAQSRGVTTFFLSPPNRESWMGVSTANDAAEYAEWLLAMIKRCDAFGVRFPYVSISNEPSFTFNNMSGAFIRDVIKNLGPRLRAEGFATMIMLADDISPSSAAQVTRTVMADPAARTYVGAIGTHLYAEGMSSMGGLQALSAQYNVPLWMTEFSSGTNGASSWANLMHELIGTFNVSAVNYMLAYSGTWGNAQWGVGQLININQQGDSYAGYSINKEYYVMGQYSRFIKPGSVRIGVSGSTGGLKVTAFKNGSKIIIVVINDSGGGQVLSAGFTGTTVPTVMQGIYTAFSGSQNWSALSGVSVANGILTATVPASSIATFVSTP